jgi:hypothetical protein
MKKRAAARKHCSCLVYIAPFAFQHPGAHWNQQEREFEGLLIKAVKWGRFWEDTSGATIRKIFAFYDLTLTTLHAY